MRTYPSFLALFAATGFIGLASSAVSAQVPTQLAADEKPSAEKPPAASVPCFAGSTYRKAVSSTGAWTGISGEVVLPTFTPDPKRKNPKTGKPLDNPSVYLGGHAGPTEIDCGVSWEVIKEPDGTVSKIGKAFRPFWRNKKWSAGPADPQYYFYPGDTIRITCWTEAADKLKMKIELLARKDQPRPDKPISTLDADFDAYTFGPGKDQEFKRVDAIDQSGNEGKPFQPTDATVSGLEWVKVDLLRGDERLPMIPSRFTDMRCPSPHLVKVSEANAAGGEKVDLIGR